MEKILKIYNLFNGVNFFHHFTIAEEQNENTAV
jgi:hypothetical protein